jgi:hypothetical protein
MSRYTPDGGVIPRGVSLSTKRDDEHTTLFGLFRGIVVRTIFPDDPKNTNGSRMEYVIKVRGQEYPNAVSIKDIGGIYNYEETILKSVEKSFDGKISTGNYDENVDGNVVYVMFLEGHGNIPIIIGSAEHSRKSKYKPTKKADGRTTYKEFNGVEVSIDKDSNYQVKQVGRKDPEGKILNDAAKDALLKLFGNGDFEINNFGTTADDLRVKMTKASKKIEIYAQKNKIIMDADGIVVKDKFNNSITLKDGKVIVDVQGDATFTTTGKADFTVGGDANLTVTGKTTIASTGEVSITSPANATFSGDGGTKVGSAGSVTDVNGSLVNLAGGGVPVAKVGSTCIGVGNLGIPVISNIVDGSVKVTTA